MTIAMTVALSSPNGLRFSGERSGAERVRRNRGLGGDWRATERSAIRQPPQEQDERDAAEDGSHNVTATPSREQNSGATRRGLQRRVQELFGCGQDEDQRKRDQHEEKHTRPKNPEI